MALIAMILLARQCTAQEIYPPTSEVLPVLSVNTPCRIEPEVQTCGLPLYLANFQVSCILPVETHFLPTFKLIQPSTLFATGYIARIFNRLFIGSIKSFNIIYVSK